MSDTSRLFPLSDQPPAIQLIVSAIIILFTGMTFLLLFIIAGSLISGVGLNEILEVSEGNLNEGNQIIFKYLQAVQGISLFIIPPVIISFLMTKRRGNWLLIRNIPSFNSIILIICLVFLMIPVISFTGLFNSKMDLPSWLEGIETWMRGKEDTATYLTGVLLDADNFAGLLINLLVIAILPALGEEFLFRGVLQQIFQKMFRSGHLAIWVTAIIFSSIHLQFYGFLPRVILGLVFGYLFFWGRSIWLPVAAHFLNNAIPVVSSYHTGWKETSSKTIEFAESNIIFLFISAILCILILLYFRHNYTMRTKERTSDIIY